MSFVENNLPTPSDDTNNLLRKMLNVLLGGLSGGGSVSGSVAINDGTVATTKAQVTNAAAAADAFGLVVRVAGDTGGAITIADGADVALGAKADVAITNPATPATAIALLKGSMTYLSTIQTNVISSAESLIDIDAATGSQGNAANTNPAASATVISNLKGVLSLITTGNSSLSSILSNTGTIVTNTGNTVTQLTTLNTKVPALGQALMAASTPVVIASNQTAIPVTFSNTTIAVTQSTSPWVVSGTVAANCTQTTSPWVVSGTVAVSGISGTVGVTQSTSPWVISNANLDVALSTLALKNQFPTALGATTKAGSNSVAIATDTYGQATKANSLPVTLASDTGDLPIKIGAATATTGTQTGAGSTTATSIGNYPTVLVSIHGTYGISSGVFEASDDAGGTFYPVFGVRSDSNIIDAGFTSIAANTSRMWVVPINGASQFRVRTTSVASGTMSISITPTAAAVTDGSVVAVTPSQGPLTDKSGTITSGGVAQTLAAANTARKYIIIQNNSVESLWINFTTTAVQTQPSIQLLPNGSYVMEASFVSTELISIIGATTGSAFSAKEG